MCHIEKEVKKDKDEDFSSAGPPSKPVYKHGGCGNIQPTVRLAALQLFTTKTTKGEDDAVIKNRDVMTPEVAQGILRRISDDDLRDMGLNVDYARPDWLIINTLPVPPPPVRPSISMDGSGTGMRNEDDLTYKLGDILRANSNVRQAIAEGSPSHIITDFENLLQYHVATYMDNDIAGQPQALQKSGRPVRQSGPV